MVHSFDIFDTVLTRRVASPHDVFALLAERLRAEGIPVPSCSRFVWLRIRSERWAARFVENRAVTLEHIYRLLGTILFWSESVSEQAMNRERELEASLLSATPYGLDAVNSSRSAGHRVSFISDMYLDSGFLGQLLRREGLMHEGDLLMVSCEQGASKADGDIWPIFLAKSVEIPTRCWHRGDNKHGDVASPQKHDIQASRLGTAETSRWEAYPRSGVNSSIVEWGSVAALSRMARAMTPAPDDYCIKFGTGLLGPWVLGFAAWALTQAKERGLRTLWFLSRDAWWFYQAALQLPEAEGMDLRYVAINRVQLRFASEGVRPEREWFSGTRSVTWALLQERLALSSVDLQQLQLACGVSAESRKEVLDAPLQGRITQILRQDSWTALLKQRASSAGAAARSYLQQCAKGATAIAIVDVGWHGSSQALLQTICPEVRQGFYLGLCNEKAAPDKQAWLYDTGHSTGALTLNRHQRMMEVFISGVTGPLRGYQQVEGKWQGVFFEKDESEFTPGLATMHEASQVFVKLALQSSYRTWWSIDLLRQVTVTNLMRLLDEADQEDAGFFLPWRITTDDAHQDTVAPCAGYDGKRIWACLTKKQPWALLWPSAAMCHTRLIWRWCMKIAWQMKRRVAS